MSCCAPGSLVTRSILREEAWRSPGVLFLSHLVRPTSRLGGRHRAGRSRVSLARRQWPRRAAGDNTRAGRAALDRPHAPAARSQRHSDGASRAQSAPDAVSGRRRIEGIYLLAASKLVGDSHGSGISIKAPLTKCCATYSGVMSSGLTDGRRFATALKRIRPTVCETPLAYRTNMPRSPKSREKSGVATGRLADIRASPLL